ncbi:TadE/TadG family type IV pilus assembly protein [Nocardiopsis sp. RSe5-2]|uniref:TadE/TadG family type IV pilus assembly protein n=1 Tax=Nocardiopsis endophytica TaxID=3018445 RepID=A0ABT4U2F6_9ACTN|nr:TadE/TadG family type IV pilus assembly protein [Nocardiopsis endophytica]MDA2811136.1 TadE/TadG family type IV pilus assembly protein [Nocardiopsis endophytica]
MAMALFRSRPPFIAGSGRRGDRGSQFLEAGIYFPLLLVVVALVMELFAAFMAMERLGNAARHGARVASEQGVAAGTEAARGSLPGWLDHAEVTSGSQDGTRYVEATAEAPFLVPAGDFGIEISRRVDMPAL